MDNETMIATIKMLVEKCRRFEEMFERLGVDMSPVFSQSDRNAIDMLQEQGIDIGEYLRAILKEYKRRNDLRKKKDIL